MGIFKILTKIFKKDPIQITEKNDIQNTYTKQNNLDEKIKELNEYHQKKSYEGFKHHEKTYKNFNPETDLVDTDNKPLTSVEISFLDYINNAEVDNLQLPVYWTYEYNINYKYLISKFINNGYLEVITYRSDLNKLKVEELKGILKYFKLKVSGKKSELIERINLNLSIDQLKTYFGEIGKRYYSVTKKGLELTKNQPKSITKNLDYEDKCLKFISENNFYNAYKAVCEYELSKKSPRGLGIDWNVELQKGLSSSKIDFYKNIKNLNFPDVSNDILIPFLNSYILYDLLGKKFNYVVFNRLTDFSYSNEIPSLAGDILFEIDKLYSNSKLLEYKKVSNDKYYRILVPKDECTCNKCRSMDDQIYHLKEAKIGENYPPFHQDCRCVATIIFDKNSEMK